MKARKLGLILPSLFLLASCGPLSLPEVEPEEVLQQAEEAFTPYVTVENGLPTIYATKGGDATVYLMLGPKASITKAGVETKGDVADKFYENTVVYKAAPGTPLPTAAEVNSGVDGATFRGWAFYNEENENVWPDYYDTVTVDIANKALKAIFDGTKTSGGGSGGGGGGGGGGQPTATGFGIRFSDGTSVLGSESGTDHAGRKQYLISGQHFNVGDVFSLYDASTQATWAIDLDEWSLGATEGNLNVWTTYLTKGTDSYRVLKEFTGDLYIKLSMEVGDQLYIGLK